MTIQDAYNQLGVPSSASLREVKRAFRKKAKLLHPDKNPSPQAAELFIRLDEAYDLICDVRAGRRTAPTRSAYHYSQPSYEEQQRRKAERDKERSRKRQMKREQGRMASEYIRHRRGVEKNRAALSGCVGFLGFIVLTIAMISIIVNIKLATGFLMVMTLIIPPFIAYRFIAKPVFHSFDKKFARMKKEFKMRMWKIEEKFNARG